MPRKSGPRSVNRAGEDLKARRHVYGRTKGKTLKPRQAQLMETLFPKVSISLEESSIDPRALFENAKDIWLEVGFGGGEHLAWHAERNRNVGFLGCEPFINGVAKLVSEIDEKKLANVRIHADDARFLLTRLKPGSLARVFILYPDPWPKSRHNKRRFVNDETLALIVAALRDDGELRFASDIPDYVAWTLAHIRRFNESAKNRLEWLAESPADWRERPADWPQTRYEEKARREGRQPAYLTFRKKGLEATCEKPGKSAI